MLATVQLPPGASVTLMIDGGDGVWRCRAGTYSAGGAGSWMSESFEATLLQSDAAEGAEGAEGRARFGLAIALSVAGTSVGLASVTAGPVFAGV
jgi:hypothetical protein